MPGCRDARSSGLPGLILLIAPSIPATAGAQDSPDLCLQASPPELSAPPNRIRFGITPQLAGTVGTVQGEVVAEDPTLRSAALRALRPAHRTMVIRLNRLFMSDGDAGIARFAARARRYARAGFAIESQVRYHPSPSRKATSPPGGGSSGAHPRRWAATRRSSR